MKKPENSMRFSWLPRNQDMTMEQSVNDSNSANRDDIFTFSNGMKLSAQSELERWRAETLFSKEPETIAWIRAFGKEFSTFFDVGANIGAYSVLAAVEFSSLNVFAFEPVVDNFIQLNQNKKLNSLINLHIFQIGLSEKNALTELYIRDPRIGNSGAQLRAPIDEKGDEFVAAYKDSLLSMQIDTLRSLFGLPVPNFMKIDVDGHEESILNGAIQTLGQTDMRSILIEANGNEARERIQRQLSSYGFKPDSRFNDMPDHSANRRRNKIGNIATNVVYSKI